MKLIFWLHNMQLINEVNELKLLTKKLQVQVDWTNRHARFFYYIFS